MGYIETLPSMGHDAYFETGLGRTLCYTADLVAPVSMGPESGAALLHILSKNCVGDTTSTPLFQDLFQIVLERGGDPNIRDEEGRTPLLLLLFNTKVNKDTVLCHLHQLVSYGANPWISDNAGNNAILAAAMSPEYSEACLHCLLRGSLEAQKEMHQKLQKRSVLQHCGIQEWLSAVDAKKWSEARNRLHDLGAPETLKKCAFKVIAECYLEDSKWYYEGTTDKKEKRRRYNARIIRECHNERIRLETKYYDDLVGLCL